MTPAQRLQRTLLLVVSVPLGVAACRGANEPSTAAGAGGATATVAVPTASETPRVSAATTASEGTSPPIAITPTVTPSTTTPPSTQGLGAWADTPPPRPQPGSSPPRIGQPHPLPSCPHGTFCGPAPLARAERAGDLEKLGCPVALDPKTWVGASPHDPGTPPGGERAVGVSLDEPATSAKRAKRDATTCCYEWFIPCPGGRPLVAGGVTRVAPLARTTRWI